MKFQKHVKREVRELLSQQLKQYEKEISMTEEERRLLHEWVASGRSPYDNGDYIYTGGVPADFISALRMERDLQEWFDNLSEEEKLAEIHGSCYQYDTAADDISVETLPFNLLDMPDEELPFQ